MSLLDRILPRRKSLGTYSFDTATYTHADVELLLAAVRGMEPGELWGSQPHLRTVVTFTARNIAQLGLHVFERVSDTDRRRVRDSVPSRVLAHPNPGTTRYELVYGLVADLALYDEAYWLIGYDDVVRGQETLTRIPPDWITSADTSPGLYGPSQYRIGFPDGRVQTVPAANVLAFHGWSPWSLSSGSSPVNALKDILAEQIQAAKFRGQVWRNGGRVSSVLNRPKDAPPWSDTAREQFLTDWRATYAGDGPGAGGTPLLEDGMTLQQLGFSAHDQEFVEGSKLALTTVASVFHINPTMVGLLDNANYSNVREFRKMLYGDSLGPVISQIEDRINAVLLPRLGADEGIYAEFNIAEKLKGSFEEQSTAIQSAVGRPWMTADEARGRFNMAALGGNADELVTPLNVLVGGQASPTDAGTQNRNAALPMAKARVPETHEEKYRQTLKHFFDRQGSVVRSSLSSKAGEDWWDADRWDRELAQDLFGLAVQTSSAAAVDTLGPLGFSQADYDATRTFAFLTAVSARVAKGVNIATKQQLDAALASDNPQDAVRNVFENARDARTAEVAATQVTMMSAFGSTESARQVSGNRALKTWQVTSDNPRPSHAAMNGETVGIDEKFSNGADWPADGVLPVDEVAGCTCAVQVTIP